MTTSEREMKKVLDRLESEKKAKEKHERLKKQTHEANKKINKVIFFIIGAFVSYGIGQTLATAKINSERAAERQILEDSWRSSADLYELKAVELYDYLASGNNYYVRTDGNDAYLRYVTDNYIADSEDILEPKDTRYAHKELDGKKFYWVVWYELKGDTLYQYVAEQENEKKINAYWVKKK